ncbi:MAG TPA: SDR family oxidoreductase [Longimicrobiales bacterium]|nr:SDR family oxidoreductase [Longimicrobiales bacterium]
MIANQWGRIITVSGLDVELANVYAFLSSDDASYVTGQTLHVNGGDLRY